MHMGLGKFKIIRIDKNLDAVTMYENHTVNFDVRLEYLCRFQNASGYAVIAGGSREIEGKEDKREFQEITYLFQIDEYGNCDIRRFHRMRRIANEQTDSKRI